MIDFNFITTISKVLGLIQSSAKVGNSFATQAQKNKIINQILQKLNLSPLEMNDNVEVVYTYVLIEYGISKPKSILKLLGKPEVKDYFWTAYTNNNCAYFLDNLDNFLKQNPKLKQEIEQDEINLECELKEWGNIFITYAKKTRADKFKIDGCYPDWDFSLIPSDFRALIEEKTRLFCGRDFIFQEFDKFINSNTKGYFTVIGDAGMGKSSIASKYILKKNFPCYFNIATEGKNKPEQFLNNIRQQLIRRYILQNQDNADLKSLLQKASEKLSEEQKLIIVVDALDEVEQEGSSNLLDLPQNLPNSVYFLLTRRPYNPETQRLNTSPDTPYKLEFRLRQNYPTLFWVLKGHNLTKILV